DIADDQLLVDYAVNFGLLLGCGQHNREATALKFLLVEAVAHCETRPGQPHTTHSGDVCVVTHCIKDVQHRHGAHDPGQDLMHRVRREDGEIGSGGCHCLKLLRQALGHSVPRGSMLPVDVLLEGDARDHHARVAVILLLPLVPAHDV